MEREDLDLIEQLTERDPELKKFWDDHLEYERQLEEFNRRPYLTAAETLERKRLQKLKLAGRPAGSASAPGGRRCRRSPRRT